MVLSRFGWDVEQHFGFVSAYAREGTGADALLSRDEPKLVVAIRLGLLEVDELLLHLQIGRGLRTKFSYAPVPLESGSLLGSRD